MELNFIVWLPSEESKLLKSKLYGLYFCIYSIGRYAEKLEDADTIAQENQLKRG